MVMLLLVHILLPLQNIINILSNALHNYPSMFLSILLLLLYKQKLIISSMLSEHICNLFIVE